MKLNPTISIITGTLNPNPSVFSRMLASVANQQYPKGRIEHLVIDGGSGRDTIELARRFGCRVRSYPKLRQKEQIRFSRGLYRAKAELVLILESDNILPDPTWLERVVEPFVKERDVSYSFPAYNDYERDMSLVTKYCALIGSPDPTLFYLGKSDKIPATETIYDKGNVVKESARYWVVRFTTRNLPTLGDNGFMVRRDILMRAPHYTREYIHVDVFHDLVAAGYDRAGVVKNAVIHVMGERILTHVRRRVEVKRLFTDEKRSIRTYHIMNWKSPRDRWNLAKYVVFSLTVIEPFWVSIRGYLKIREPAWFLHPVMCFLMVAAYGWSEIVWRTRTIMRRVLS